MKIACIYHRIDLDGWMSAAIVKHWYLTHNIPNDNSIGEMIIDYITNNYIPKDPIQLDTNNLWFYGYHYGDSIPDLSEYDKVIMVDISLPKDVMFKLERKLAENLIWIDHHISAIKDIHDKGFCADGIRDTKYAACELTWQYFFPNEPMPEIVRLLGRYDCFGHKGTDEDRKVLEFQYGARQIISSYKEAYDQLYNCIIESNNKKQEFAPCEFRIWESGKSIYQYLCTEAKQSYKNGFPITFTKLMGIGGQTIKNTVDKVIFICINKERFNPINFGIEYHKDGYDGVACFWYANGKWNFSLYNDNGLVDCSEIAKQYGGGGHKGAAGFIVEDINTIIK